MTNKISRSDAFMYKIRGCLGDKKLLSNPSFVSKYFLFIYLDIYEYSNDTDKGDTSK